ncbi:MAG: hypothetical protein PHW13_12930 [Methylococcales bacterium]|nr:hypothetical protein [Methylococcales bacterium]
MWIGYKLLQNAALKIDRTSFWQEPQYTAAFFGKLHKERINNNTGEFVELLFSASNDRGKNSDENKTGIDIGMVFRWVDSNKNVIFEKAILAQAKNHLDTLNKAQANDLSKQCKKMSTITSSYIVLDCPYNSSIPKIRQHKSEYPFWDTPSISLDDYIADTVMECLDGDKKDEVIALAQRADRGHLIIKTNSPKPSKKQK